MKQYSAQRWIRVAAGGCAVIALTYLCGTRDYNGAGMDVIAAAVEQGTARPEAFLLKILFTAVTLSAGFKGGEVVPSFSWELRLLWGGAAAGHPGGLRRALGLVSVFCGATNCPLASIFLAIELFGDGGLLYYALACGISYMLSGYNGLYSSQTILYSKLKAQYINVRTNAYHAGEPVDPFRSADGETEKRGLTAAAEMTKRLRTSRLGSPEALFRWEQGGGPQRPSSAQATSTFFCSMAWRRSTAAA